jgi:hypothetical protein
MDVPLDPSGIERACRCFASADQEYPQESRVEFRRQVNSSRGTVFTATFAARLKKWIDLRWIS